MRGIALCCATAMLAGCSLLLSTSDLAEQAPGPDAGTTSEAEGGVDATPTVVSDAAADVTLDAFDSGKRFCETLSPAPKFCADFDGPGGLEDGFTNVTVDPTSAGSVTKDSLGRDRWSAFAKLVTPTSCSYARPARTFPTTGSGLRVAFSFRPSGSWANDAIFAQVKLEKTNAAGCSILLRYAQGYAGVHFQFGAPTQDLQFDWEAAPELDAWSHIEMTIGTGNLLTITLDSKKVFARGLDCSLGDKVYVAPGFHCEETAHEARYDDVVVDYP